MEYLPLYARDLICFFSCIGKWTQESLEQIILKVKMPVKYWERRYQEFLKHSFVIVSKDGGYYIHDTVRIAAYGLADEEMKKKVRNAKIELFEENRDINTQILESDKSFKVYIEYLYNEYAVCEEIRKKQKIIQEELAKLEQRGDYETCFRIAILIVKRNIELCAQLRAINLTGGNPV